MAGHPFSCCPLKSSAAVLLMCTALAWCAANGEEAIPATCHGICPEEGPNVCGNGWTYDNACMATCAGFTEATWKVGPCGFNCSVCTNEYDPVCAGGITFSSSCNAQCNGYAAWVRGSCEDVGCRCTREYAPVCANGVTYGNACVAKCKGFTPATWKVGACGEDCPCTKHWDPVCADGRTYGNPCGAKCYGYPIRKPDTCSAPCPIPKIDDPVCAPNGKTYVNTWAAQCDGFISWKRGKCVPSGAHVIS